MLSQTIIAMAHHDYLELEGGQLMIEFIVRQCALSTDAVSEHCLIGFIVRQYWIGEGDNVSHTIR